MSTQTDGPYTPQKELADMELLFASFRDAAPGTPRWYRVADHCIGILMQRRIDDLKEQCADGEHRIGEYVADYTMPTQEEIHAPNKELDDLLANSRRADDEVK